MSNNDLKLKLIHLYPKEMNIYGDRGNIITFKKRCEWRDINLEVKNIGINDKFEIGDIYFMGGGQDNDMYKVFKDLIKNKKKDIRKEVDNNKVFLLICGGFQLFGRYFLDATQREIEGLSILPIETKAPNNTIKDRCLGNIITRINPELLNLINSAYESIESDTFVGFENHSGQTYSIKTNYDYLGRVLLGKGNNIKDKIEGYRYMNIFSTYMHGPLLPKNPHLADYLIYTALQNKYGDKFLWKQLDDSVEWSAHKLIKEKY